MTVKRMAYLGMLCCVAMIFSFIESQIPSFVAIPAIKMGLPNIVIIVILYKLGAKEAILVNIVRMLLTSLLFGNLMMLTYSFGGAALSIIAMLIMKKLNFNVITVSVLGGVFHNVGQIIVAAFVVSTVELLYYLPVLIITGTISGILIGLIGALVVKKLEPIEF